MFDVEQVKTAVNADTAEIFTWGYFSNNLADLRRSIEQRKINLYTVYTCLKSVLSEKAERRFETRQGNFSLFYPLDSEEVKARY